MNKISQFLISLILLGAFQAGLLYWLQTILPPKATFENFGLIITLVGGITFLFHYFLLRASAGSGAAFIRSFMGATAFKLFLFMIILVGYSLFNETRAFGFIINFFISYLLFTAFEVAFIYRQFRGPNQQS